MIVYRFAEEKDIDAICRLGDVVNRLHHVAWPNLFSASEDENQCIDHWRVGAFGKGAVAIVAENTDFIVGFIALGIFDEKNPLLKPIRFAHIGAICVDESVRGQGIGTELMRRAERWAEDRGAIDVRLNAWSFNKNAIALYEALGYEIRSVNMGKVL